ncbi:DUF1292 domain-containing protein [Paenibacillus sedimenti]|uniref:DUF1292 domain-containing protein n=1 Tax=Paenibacillus sedimenti TaxID=2770274 RepID=A0A926KQR9_9BACL|nr:DUF1292 domain-containing protein [Paenibacillus sedimenti]MBD0381757.1 DUF1292 domain-containing protein [Paenibacillus sedimenti]
MSVTQTDVLRNAYGDDIILFDEQNESTVYHLLKEFVYGNNTYAVLQSDALKKEDDVAIFRVVKNSDEQYELETIEDDDEWETVAELYDEMVFPVQDDL